MMSIPVSLRIDCANADLKKELEEDLCDFLPSMSIQPESESRNEQSVSAEFYEDSDSEHVDIPLTSTPIIISRIENFISRETPTDTLFRTQQNETNETIPPTSPYFENEDPLCTPVLREQSGHNCNKNCLSNFQIAQINEYRLNMLEMEKECKDMLIMGQLQSCGVSRGNKTRCGERKRQKFSYQYDNTDVCKECFLYINGIGGKYLKNIKKHMKTNGVVPRVHGNSSKKPKHAVTYEDAKLVVTFLESYSQRNGMPQPAARRGRDDTPPVYLPKSCTYVSVHKEYEASCQEMGVRILSETTFRRIWHQCVPHITFMAEGTDVCPICEDFRDRVKTNFNTEEERWKLAEDLTRHLQEAQAERDFYREQCKQAVDELKHHEKIENPQPCSQELYKVHYTFDFANSVLIPTHVRQEGPLYYKSPLKCMWFGVCNDGRTQQTNYLFSERNCIGTDGGQAHSSNAVVSMVDHHFAHKSEGEKNCYLNADNCGGQNKNQVMTGYLCWRVMTGKHQEIYLHFMKPYHARCLVDGMFGLGRKSLRRHDIDCIADVKTAVQKSSVCASVLQYDTDHQNPSSAWIWRDWKSFLKPLFRPVPHIQKYQHFRFSSSHPGSVFVKESVDTAEKKIKILKKNKQVEVGQLPIRLEAAGLSDTRSWYLYKNVRQYVHHPHKDTTCPLPNVAEPSN